MGMTNSANPSSAPFIILSGNIGAGKTTLTHKIGQELGLWSHFESVNNNPYLEDFYKDMPRWSFPLQVYFLNHRFKTHRSIISMTAGAIQDRSIYEDANIFALALKQQGQMSERDYDTYLALYRSMTQFLRPPHLMIYLKRSVDGLMERIALRGREYEKSIPREYLKHLGILYDQWVESYDFGPKLIIETDGKDFLENKNDWNLLVKLVKDHLNIQTRYESASNLTGSAYHENKTLWFQ